MGGIGSTKVKPCRILVCGNPTIDELETVDDQLVSPGGSALFSSCAAAYLGAKVKILGRVGEDYPTEVIRRLRRLGLDLSSLKVSRGPSTRFGISESIGSRTLKLIEPGSRIVATTLRERFDGIHMGPVFNEITPSLVKTLYEQTNFLSADIQGFIRTVSRAKSVRTTPRNLSFLMRRCKMLQASIDEARLQTGSREPKRILNGLMSSGIRFGILTMGGRGSYLGISQTGSHFVPAFPEPRALDSTGAGDIFAGSWLRTYLSTKDPIWASSLGSAFASLASRMTGLSKFRIRRVELFRRAGWVYKRVRRIDDPTKPRRAE